MHRLGVSRSAAAAVVATAAVAGPLAFSYWAPASSAAAPPSATAAAAAAAAAGSGKYSPPTPALTPADFKGFKLATVERLSPDTKRYTFALEEGQELGLTVASFLLIRGPVGSDGKPMIRPYTPTSPVHRRGSFDLVVKSYPSGNVSKFLDTLTPGATVDMKGPIVKFSYEPNKWEAVGMVAGGSGITPMYQLIQEILSNPRDKTEIRLVYANRGPADILLKRELDALALVHPQFKVLYTVDKPDAEWKGTTGHMTKEMLTSMLPPPQLGPGRMRVFVCGPPGMMRHISGEKKSPADQGDLTGLLAAMAYDKDAVFKY